jgi:hypothetical protein
MIQESDIRQAIIEAGFTFSAESGEDYPMRNIPLARVTGLVIDVLRRRGVNAQRDEKYLGKGKRAYYLARADLARKAGNNDLAKSYEMLVGALPWGDDNE